MSRQGSGDHLRHVIGDVLPAEADATAVNGLRNPVLNSANAVVPAAFLPALQIKSVPPLFLLSPFLPFGEHSCR